jgi:hypothetical protein
MPVMTAFSTHAALRLAARLSVVIVMLLSLAGCGDDPARSSTPPPAVGTTGIGGAGVGGAVGTVGTTGVGGSQMLMGGAGGMPGLQCQPGFTNCNGVCVDLLGAADNCGACGSVCPVGRLCSMGACSSECVAPYTQCGEVCVNLSNDAGNCGACGEICELGLPCVGGGCGCPDGTLLRASVSTPPATRRTAAVVTRPAPVARLVSTTRARARRARWTATVSA